MPFRVLALLLVHLAVEEERWRSAAPEGSIHVESAPGRTMTPCDPRAERATRATKGHPESLPVADAERALSGSGK